MKETKFEVLVSTMHKNKEQVILMLDEMNVQCDATVVVQGDVDGYEEEMVSDRKIRIVFSKERGLSKSRNLALRSSSADIVLIADDDLLYNDNFQSLILSSFGTYSDKDFIIFNVDNYDRTYPDVIKKVHWHQILGFSSWQIAFKRTCVLDKKIFFNEKFGTGSGVYFSGEENIFLACCFKYFKMIYLPEKILKRHESESSWFTGYNEKYLFDRGAIFYAISPLLCPLLILQFAIRRRALFPSYSFFKVMKQMVLGMVDCIRNNNRYCA